MPRKRRTSGPPVFNRNGFLPRKTPDPEKKPDYAHQPGRAAARVFAHRFLSEVFFAAISGDQLPVQLAMERYGLNNHGQALFQEELDCLLVRVRLYVAQLERRCRKYHGPASAILARPWQHALDPEPAGPETPTIRLFECFRAAQRGPRIPRGESDGRIVGQDRRDEHHAKS